LAAAPADSDSSLTPIDPEGKNNQPPIAADVDRCWMWKTGCRL
jgi:hypothetical protein